MYLILSPHVEPSDLSDRADALVPVGVDYADLLQLTLSNWRQIEGASTEELFAMVEGYINTTWVSRRLEDYAHMQEVAAEMVGAVRTFHDGLHHQLAPLLENTQFGIDITLRLSRFMHKDIVVRLESPPPEKRHGT